MPPRTDRNTYWVGLAALLGGLGGALLIAASQTNRGGWALFFVISGVCAILASVYLFGALFVGRGLPDMGEERRNKRREREEAELLAHLVRRDALQELRDELKGILRGLNAQLDNDRITGVIFPNSAWSKNAHFVSAPDDATVAEVYELLKPINQKATERFDNASHDDVNSDEWRRLSDEERRERQHALLAAYQALFVVEGFLLAEKHP